MKLTELAQRLFLKDCFGKFHTEDLGFPPNFLAELWSRTDPSNRDYCLKIARQIQESFRK